MIYFLVPQTFSKDYKISRRSNCVVKVKGDYIYPPIEMATMAAYIRSKGYDVALLDGNISPNMDYMLGRIKNPLFLVVNVGIVSFENDKRFITILKEKFPESNVISYGQAATALPLEVLEFSDYVCYGEPEKTVLDIIKGKPEKAVFYNKDGNVYSNKEINLVDLSEFPLPARDLLENNKYRHAFLEPFTEIFTSRGCPYRCTFCTSKRYFGSYRYRSTDSVIRELEEIHQKYGMRNFGFADDTFTINKEIVRAVCNFLITKKMKMKWLALSRVDTIDYETLKLMKKAGCSVVLYGIESGSQFVLDKLKKEITLPQIRNAIKWTKKAKLEAHGYFVFGSPYDTKETIFETIKFAKSLSLDYASFNLCIPYPNTQLYDQLKQQNKITRHAYEDFDQNAKTKVFKHDNLTDGEVRNLIRKAYIGFYFSPRYLIRKLVSHSFSLLKLKRDVSNMFVLIKNLIK